MKCKLCGSTDIGIMEYLDEYGFPTGYICQQCIDCGSDEFEESEVDDKNN